MTQHTPGPWHRNIKPAIRYPTIFAGRNIHVARVISDNLPVEEIEANCDLITAAPDLLAALNAMWTFASEMVERHGMDGDDTMTDADHKAWQEAAGTTGAAISKATGDVQ